ncbi:MAG: hypothetical protein C5B49_15865 [Bdellovibrio sp.]|nr:MAG: hypothetical protein C5B49_15865 [Bdellovibrio sp.]
MTMGNARIARMWKIVFATACLCLAGCDGFHWQETATDLPSNHPPADGFKVQTKVTTSQPLIIDRFQVASAAQEAFSSAQASTAAAIATSVQSHVDAEIRPVQQFFGRACNPYETGDSSDCNGSLVNSSLALGATDSSGREAARIQLCRSLVSDDALVQALQVKVSPTELAPQGSAIAELVGLFYPDLPGDTLVSLVDSLGQLDTVMAQNSEHVMDRWRILALTLCETPEWQQL